jgi:AI-2 transport protein TqsA
MTERPEASGLALPRGLLILLGFAAAVITVAGLKSISGLVAPAFLALVLTIGVHPLRGWLVRRGFPGWVATVVMILTVYAILLGLALSLVVSIARFATLLPTYQQEMSNLISEATAWLESVGVGRQQINAVAQAFDPSRLVGVATGFLSGLLSVLSNLFFIVTLLLFLALDAAWFPRRLGAAESSRGGLVAALVSFARGTRRYLVVSSVFGLIVAVLDVGLLYLLSIPVPLVWGLLAFITNYIPNIGFVVGLVPPAILGLLEGGIPGALGVILGYSVLNVIIQSVIQPKVVGDAVGLSTSLTFLSLVFWAWVLGALGALLAIPLSLLTKALLVDVDPDSRWLVPLLSGGASEPAKTARGEPQRTGVPQWLRHLGRPQVQDGRGARISPDSGDPGGRLGS